MTKPCGDVAQARLLAAQMLSPSAWAVELRPTAGVRYYLRMKIVPGSPDLEDAVGAFLMEADWPEDATSFADCIWFAALDDTFEDANDYDVIGMIYGHTLPAAEAAERVRSGDRPGPVFWVDLVVVTSHGIRLGTCLMQRLVDSVAPNHGLILLSIDGRRPNRAAREKFATECGFVVRQAGPEPVWGADSATVIAAVAARLAGRPPCP